MSIINKMLSIQGAKSTKAEIMSDTPFFHVKPTPTDLPILNMAFSGTVDGGLLPGLTIFSGDSGTFKTMLGLYCVKSYMDEHEDAACLFYDTEFGTTPEYMESFGIDMSRVLHVPIFHAEEMKFDMSKRLGGVDKGDKVIIFVDSLGALASKKEIEDAEDEKSVADMTRAKAIRSWLRVISPHLTAKELPCIVINHVYKEIGMFPKTVIPGGTAVTYLANQIFVITKAKLEENKHLDGNKFTIMIHKSRYVRQRSKFPFEVTYTQGIHRYSGLLDIAREGGLVELYGQGRYRRAGEEKGEVKKNLNGDFWQPILDNPKFREYIESSYKLKHVEVDSVDDDGEGDLIESDSE